MGGARRASYGERIGSSSNIVGVTLILPIPSIPPAFTVEFLGIDFYNRTAVEIRFTSPLRFGLFSVWWADGEFDSTSFEHYARSCEYGSQTPDNGCLYDILSIPIPTTIDRTITLGVQSVNNAGGQSRFRVQTKTLRATK